LGAHLQYQNSRNVSCTAAMLARTSETAASCAFSAPRLSLILLPAPCQTVLFLGRAVSFRAGLPPQVGGASWHTKTTRQPAKDNVNIIASGCLHLHIHLHHAFPLSLSTSFSISALLTTFSLYLNWTWPSFSSRRTVATNQGDLHWSTQTDRPIRADKPRVYVVNRMSCPR
jgi:hypothetical protein